MGQDCECLLHCAGRSFKGRAQLETDFLLFRGEQRLKILLKEVTTVSAADGTLTLDLPDGPASFDLGAFAAKWAKKISHPPTLFEKLGIKPNLAIATVGKFEPSFLVGIDIKKTGPADLLFFASKKATDLLKIPTLLARLKPNGSLWIVYPKGVTQIREIEVIQAGRAAGLKDTKVASFSPTESALRFSQPRERTIA